MYQSPVWTLPKDEFSTLVKNSSSYTEILQYFGLRLKGRNGSTLKRRLILENIDFTHIEQNKSERTKACLIRPRPLQDVLHKHTNLQGCKLKKRLIRDGLLPEVCVLCGLGPLWNGGVLVLQLDHIDGDNTNNELKNLRILCPNCHTQTATYGSKRFKRVIQKKPKFKPPRKFDPSIDELRGKVASLPITRVGAHYGVSDHAIRKRCLLLGIDLKSRGW